MSTRSRVPGRWPAPDGDAAERPAQGGHPSLSEQPPQRPQGWSSRAGFILATSGSAVGLGSIWKFPYEVGEKGGAGFLLFYGLGLLLVVLPLALVELAIDRRGGGDAPASMARLAAEAGRAQRWGWAGGLAIATGFAILSY